MKPAIHDRRKGPRPSPKPAANPRAVAHRESTYEQGLMSAVSGHPAMAVLQTLATVWRAEAAGAAPSQGLPGVYRVHETARVHLRVMTTEGTRYYAASGEAPACRPGCSACCSLDVGATPFDVFRAFLAVEQLAADVQAEVRARTADVAARTRGMTPEERWSAQIPCSLLDPVTGACRIYDARPTSCEGYYVSGDPKNCGPDGDSRVTRHLSLLRVIPMAAWGSVEGVLRAMKIDTREVAFLEALDMLLRVPSLGDRWFAGEPVFAACARDDEEAAR